MIKESGVARCLPLTSVAELILSVNAKVGSSAHFLSRLAPVHEPIALVSSSGTGVA